MLYEFERRIWSAKLEKSRFEEGNLTKSTFFGGFSKCIYSMPFYLLYIKYLKKIHILKFIFLRN